MVSPHDPWFRLVFELLSICPFFVFRFQDLFLSEDESHGNVSRDLAIQER
jgi:hypothetical protein